MTTNETKLSLIADRVQAVIKPHMVFLLYRRKRQRQLIADAYERAMARLRVRLAGERDVA
jgi:hypothetical protein